MFLYVLKCRFALLICCEQLRLPPGEWVCGLEPRLSDRVQLGSDVRESETECPGGAAGTVTAGVSGAHASHWCGKGF